jgi:hypothetical protein
VLGGPSPTLTPIPGPTIFSFSANQASVLNNTTVIFSWSTDADVVNLEQTDLGGITVFQNIPLPQTGQFSVLVQTTPGGGRQAFFRLVAARNGIVTRSMPIVIAINCPAGWFFGDQFAPPGTGCPATVGAIGPGAFQRFERGFMIYTNANGLNRICMAQDAGARYICVINGWDNQTINNTAAPNGLYRPEQMLNWAYYNTLAVGGTWNSVIGWALNPIALGSRTIQYENANGGSNPFYIDTADGTIIRFSGGDSGTWTRIR